MRQVERLQVAGGVEERKAAGHPTRYGNTANKSGAVKDGSWSMPHFETQVNTVGWQPSCACGADPVPCTVLDPFGGAGTTGLVADRLQRNAVLIELNPAYAAMSSNRIKDDAPLFAEVAQP